MKKALFIDRDGTVIAEPPADYQVDSLEKLEFIPGAISALRTLRGLDFELVMVESGEAAWAELEQPDSAFDLVLLEQQVGLQLLSREPALQKSLAWQGQTLVRMPLFVGFVPPKPGHTDWAQVYAHGLSALFANGEYLRILQKHSQAIP